MQHSIGYNSQRNNYSFLNMFPAWSQCFSTSAWMFMSFYSSKIKAEDDETLAVYVDDVEDSVGSPGVGEIIKRKYDWIKGRTSLWWLVQEAGITKWLNRFDVKGKAKFVNGGTYFDVNMRLETGPVIIGTDKLGGLPGGHIILLIGLEGSDYIVNDPYGNANTLYSDKNGKAVKYSQELIKTVCGVAPLYIGWDA